MPRGPLRGAGTAPGGIADTGAHLYHLTTGSIDRRLEGCAPECPYDGRLRVLGDHTPVSVTSRHDAAEQARDARRQAARRWPVRLRRAVDDLIAGYR
ncbi:hypothetical protein ACKI1I_15590 [Streptomyces turgidiscabies]|uniref:hypothetical protein n=1 Tax=Streptomyces TaxID=1883 RepID=UPI00117E08DE|nr:MULTISPECIES: hypothetical protein [Streptomyces]MDX3495254.1 hypothetical protein [Streptomyces turgidiscabies]